MSLPVFTHSACLEHDTGAGPFERPQRLGAVIDALRTGVAADIDWLEAPRATRGPLPRVPDASLPDGVLVAGSETSLWGQEGVSTRITRGSPDTLKKTKRK